MEELKAMFRVCTHIKKDGTRCNSPALKGGNFCFHHIGGSLREHTRARSIYNGPRLDFLYPGTRQAIQNNLFVVAQAMNDGKLELATASAYNRIFSACERNLRRFEMLYQKPGPEPELPEIPDEADADRADGGDQTIRIVIPTGESAANEAEEPALSPSSGNANNREQNPSVSSVSPVVNPSANKREPEEPASSSTSGAMVDHPLKHDSGNREQPNETDVILSGVEEPAFSSASGSAADGPRKHEWETLAPVPSTLPCAHEPAVLQTEYSSLLLPSEPESYEEWLRDGPCDATTTGSGNLRHRCQLSPDFRQRKRGT